MAILSKWVPGFIVATILTANCSAENVYTTQASYNAATSGQTTVNFSGDVAPGTYTSVARTINGPDGSSISTSSPYLYAIDIGGRYGADTVFSAQGTSPGLGAINDLVLTLPTGATSLSVLFNAFTNLGNVDTTYLPDTVTITLSDGTTEEVTQAIADGSYAFLGFTSSTPITSITLSESATADSTLNLAQVQYGSAVTPEPSSISLLGLGMFTLIAGVAYRKRFTAAILPL